MLENSTSRDRRMILIVLMLPLLLIIGPRTAIGQTTAFTYQGRLTDGGTLANGTYDMQFKLFDAVSAGAQVGSTVTNSTVSVTNGVFTVSLDFGIGAFPAADRFLEISIRHNSGESYTMLSPRQQVTSTPYAIRSSNSALADTATNATQLGGVAASQYVLTSDSRLSDPRSPTAGSSNYIQNTSSQQTASDFNISGNGMAAGTLSANIVNATTQYNIGGSRFLSRAGTNNTFAGLNAGTANTLGSSNSFFGRSAGDNNTTGTSNSFFGSNAGFLNTTGGDNSFFGSFAGASNMGSHNSFFGKSAGAANTTGLFNSFFGSSAGSLNTTGDNNSFFGTLAGNANTTGSNNTIIGRNADVGGGNLSFATAIGAGAIVSDSNSIVLGRADGSDAVRIPGAVLIDGSLVVKTLGTANTSAQICRNTADRLSPCSSSLRYKTDVKTFLGGFDIVNRLRPISFTWKEGGMRDVGLGAEEVEQVAPLLIFRNDKGEIEGVKYNQLTAVLINAIKEQQKEIDELKGQVRQLRAAAHRRKVRR